TVNLAAPLSSTKDITSFSIDGETVNNPATAFTITLPAGTDVTALSPSIIHTGASINPASGVAQDFTSPVDYTVTAADGTTQVYTVTVNLAAPLSSTKDITSFSIDGETVNNPATAFTITLPAGTDVTALSPSITHTGASINPASGVVQDFSSPTTYTVTAADGTTQVYSVTVTAPALSSTKAITAFTIGGVNATISGTNISLILPAGTDVTALSPSITHTGVSINPATNVAQDFTSPVEYTVTAADTTTKTYTVTAIPNIPPTVSATFLDKFSKLNLIGTASDSDGTIESYLWEFVSSSTVADWDLFDATQASTEILMITTGTFFFKLTVTDNDGATASDIVKFTISSDSDSNPDPDPDPDPITSFNRSTGKLTAPGGTLITITLRSRGAEGKGDARVSVDGSLVVMTVYNTSSNESFDKSDVDSFTMPASGSVLLTGSHTNIFDIDGTGSYSTVNISNSEGTITSFSMDVNTSMPE
ncbi:DUF5018 domain-containing protein, partial [Cellulophaga baltica]|uniref:DUF5018 domain-containing protein n=1 Tax=Cellulophaga baltica TaxID=76594 RepID=UPI00214949AA|nr:DUF5018 domain-containing protein [Cellulophaga baltica]